MRTFGFLKFWFLGFLMFGILKNKIFGYLTYFENFCIFEIYGKFGFFENHWSFEKTVDVKNPVCFLKRGIWDLGNFELIVVLCVHLYDFASRGPTMSPRCYKYVYLWIIVMHLWGHWIRNMCIFDHFEKYNCNDMKKLIFVNNEL